MKYVVCVFFFVCLSFSMVINCVIVMIGDSEEKKLKVYFNFWLGVEELIFCFNYFFLVCYWWLMIFLMGFVCFLLNSGLGWSFGILVKK